MAVATTDKAIHKITSDLCVASNSGRWHVCGVNTVGHGVYAALGSSILGLHNIYHAFTTRAVLTDNLLLEYSTSSLTST